MIELQDKINKAVEDYKEAYVQSMNESLMEVMGEAAYEAERAFTEAYDDYQRGYEWPPEKVGFEAFKKALIAYRDEVMKELDIEISKKFDKRSYQREYMRTYRAKKEV